MATHLQIFAVLLPALVLWVGSGVAADDAPRHRAELVFPLSERHNHAPGIVELPDGQLLVSWYRGAGERKADDVVVLGARLAKGAKAWSEPFTLADNPGFPDCNTCLFIDATQQLWLFWPIILDNEWGSALRARGSWLRQHQQGKPTSTNPIASIVAWGGWATSHGRRIFRRSGRTPSPCGIPA